MHELDGSAPYDPEIVASLADKRVALAGRYNLLHNGHLSVLVDMIKKTAQTAILLGSANITHSRRNPCNAVERRNCINRALYDEAQNDEELHAKMLSSPPDVLPLYDANPGGDSWTDEQEAEWMSELARIARHPNYLISGNPEVEKPCLQQGMAYLNVTTVVPPAILDQYRTTSEKLSASHIRELIRAGSSAFKPLVPYAVLEVLREVGGITDRLRFAHDHQDAVIEGHPHVECLPYHIDAGGQLLIGVNGSGQLERVPAPNGVFEDATAIRLFNERGRSLEPINAWRLPLRVRESDERIPRQLTRVRSYKEGERVISTYSLHVSDLQGLDGIHFVKPENTSCVGTRHFMEYVRGGGAF